MNNLASSQIRFHALALPFDQEKVRFSEGRKPISWSGALKSLEATPPTEAK
jgi:hypothetical protein